ncbi:MAG: hypothetical protein ACSLEM_05275 [Candidatus Malihini olakiniferum]
MSFLLTANTVITPQGATQQDKGSPCDTPLIPNAAGACQPEFELIAARRKTVRAFPMLNHPLQYLTYLLKEEQPLDCFHGPQREEAIYDLLQRVLPH